MQKFLTDLSSIYWWIGVVLVGIVINIISSYLKNKLDAYFGSISKKWARRNKAKRDIFDCKVARIKQNPQQLNLALFAEMRQRNFTTQCFIIAIISLSAAKEMSDLTYFRLFFTLLGLFLIIWGQIALDKASEIREQIAIATKEE